MRNSFNVGMRDRSREFVVRMPDDPVDVPSVDHCVGTALHHPPQPSQPYMIRRPATPEPTYFSAPGRIRRESTVFVTEIHRGPPRRRYGSPAPWSADHQTLASRQKDDFIMYRRHRTRRAKAKVCIFAIIISIIVLGVILAATMTIEHTDDDDAPEYDGSEYMGWDGERGSMQAPLWEWD